MRTKQSVSLYREKEHLLTEEERQKLSHMVKELAEAQSSYTIYSLAKSISNKYEDFMRGHGVKKTTHYAVKMRRSQVATLLAQGKSLREIQDILNVSYKIVDNDAHWIRKQK